MSYTNCTNLIQFKNNVDCIIISENSKNVALRLCKEAKKRNIKVSFDFNYRATLWTIEEARVAFNEITKTGTIFITNSSN